MVTAFNSEPVERAGIVPHHFVDDAFRYAGQRFERRQQVALFKGIFVAVVRADHQIILTDAVHDDGKVLAGFTCDKNAKLAEKGNAATSGVAKAAKPLQALQGRAEPKPL